MSAPQSTVDLFRCDLNPNGLFTCDFAYGNCSEDGFNSSTVSRDNYFANPDGGLASRYSSTPNCTFVRKDMTITVDENADMLNNFGVNYCRFKNPYAPDYGSRWTYAFITRIEYIAEQTTRLYIKTDLFTTYMGDIKRNSCMVERMHVWSDKRFSNLLPEPLSVPDAVTYSEVNASVDTSAMSVNDFKDHYLCCVVTSEGIQGLGDPRDNLIGGVPNCCCYYACELQDLSNLVDLADADSIVAVYPILRDNTVINLQSSGHTLASGEPCYYVYDAGSALKTLRIGFPQMFNTYEPKNAKCLNYPYNYVTLTNHNGSNIDLKLENFYQLRFSENNDEIKFESWYSPTPDGQLLTAPFKYEKMADSSNKQYAIEYSGFPQIAYTTDVYKNYIARHINSMNVDKINLGLKAATAIGSAAAGNVGKIPGTFMDFLEYNAKINDIKSVPDEIHGMPTGGMQLHNGSSGIHLLGKAVPEDYAKVIDDYFTRYGYNVSKIATPSWNTRLKFNYIKTAGANFGGTIPVEDKAKLNELFDSGITIWHYPGEYGDFSVANGAQG